MPWYLSVNLSIRYTGALILRVPCINWPDILVNTAASLKLSRPCVLLTPSTAVSPQKTTRAFLSGSCLCLIQRKPCVLALHPIRFYGFPYGQISCLYPQFFLSRTFLIYVKHCFQYILPLNGSLYWFPQGSGRYPGKGKFCSKSFLLSPVSAEAFRSHH